LWIVMHTEGKTLYRFVVDGVAGQTTIHDW
jgi:hypothetical protein